MNTTIINKTLAFIGLVFAALLFIPGIASAAEDTVSAPGGDATPFILIAPTVMAVIGLIIPVINGALTKYTLPSGVKAIITIVLNAVASLILTSTQADGTALISNATFNTFLFGTLVSIGSYVGLYRPLNITSSTPNGKLGPDVGVGPVTNRL